MRKWGCISIMWEANVERTKAVLTAWMSERKALNISCHNAPSRFVILCSHRLPWQRTTFIAIETVPPAMPLPWVQNTHQLVRLGPELLCCVPTRGKFRSRTRNWEVGALRANRDIAGIYISFAQNPKPGKELWCMTFGYGNKNRAIYRILVKAVSPSWSWLEHV